MTLGELMDALGKQPQENIIRFDFGDIIPGTFGSYRGYYEQLALGYEPEDSDDVTVASLLKECEKAEGATYEGYKGGSFLMNKKTPVWVSKYDRCSGTKIAGITDLGYGYSIIHTEYVEV